VFIHPPNYGWAYCLPYYFVACYSSKLILYRSYEHLLCHAWSIISFTIMISLCSCCMIVVYCYIYYWLHGKCYVISIRKKGNIVLGTVEGWIARKTMYTYMSTSLIQHSTNGGPGVGPSYQHVNACAYVCMYVCMRAYMYACINVCMQVWEYLCPYVPVNGFFSIE